MKLLWLTNRRKIQTIIDDLTTQLGVKEKENKKLARQISDLEEKIKTLSKYQDIEAGKYNLNEMEIDTRRINLAESPEIITQNRWLHTSIGFGKMEKGKVDSESKVQHERKITQEKKKKSYKIIYKKSEPGDK